MDSKRKPRLPDRLLTELHQCKDTLGKRPKEDRGRQRHKQHTRKQIRQSARLEKKQKKQRNREQYRTQMQKNTKPSIQQQQRPDAPSKRDGPSAKRSAAKDDDDSQRMYSMKHELPVVTDESKRKQSLQEDIDRENQELKKLAKRLGLTPGESGDVKCPELNGVLDGFDGRPMKGIPEIESHSNSSDPDISALEESENDSVVMLSSTDDLDDAVLSQREEPSTVAITKDVVATVARAVEKYVPPALRSQSVSGSDRLNKRADDVIRRVRGLVNRLTEHNIKGIVNEIVKMYEEIGRTFVRDAIAEDITKALAEGPKATDQFVGIAAALVSAVSVLTNGHDISSTFLSHSAMQLECSYNEGDALAIRNSINLFSHLYLCGLITSRIPYGLLQRCVSQFQVHASLHSSENIAIALEMQELDVLMIFRLLETCGLRLRSDDPEQMKRFVISVHNKAAQLSQKGDLSRKAELMLDMVIDIKNNKLSKSGRRERFVHLSPTVGKWLQEIEASKMALGHLTWQLLITQNKTGQWWLPDSNKADDDPTTATLLSTANEAGGELLLLAAKQKMNTSVRKAVFCVIMGAFDVNDACEKLLRLPLKGEQDREVMRVLVECCLQERKWNPFYGTLASKLQIAKKSHLITLKFCLLDKIKVIDEMDIRALDHLAKLMAQLLQKDVFSITTLKGVDLSLSMSEKSVLFWRVFIIHWLLIYKNSDTLTEAFSKLSLSNRLILFAKKLLVFLLFRFEPWIAQSNAAQWMTQQQRETVLKRYRNVKSMLRKYKSM